MVRPKVNILLAGWLVGVLFLGIAEAQAASIDSLLFTLRIPNTIGGVDYDANDILKYDTVSGTTSLFFDGDTLFKKEGVRIDALDIFPNGDLLISTATNAKIGSLSFKDEDLVRVNPITKGATLFLDGSSVFEGVKDLRAVDVLKDGKLVLAADGGEIAGLTFTGRDLVLYDLDTGDASLFFEGADHFEGKKGAITGVDVLDDGKLVLIVGDETDAIIGGVHVNRKDIFLYDPVNETTEILLAGGDGYFERTSHKHDQGFNAVDVPPGVPVVPEPVTSSLMGMGLLGLAFCRRRFLA